jgi:hypothetical protein
MGIGRGGWAGVGLGGHGIGLGATAGAHSKWFGTELTIPMPLPTRAHPIL